jgi:signal transduction histidine kinase
VDATLTISGRRITGGSAISMPAQRPTPESYFRPLTPCPDATYAVSVARNAVRNALHSLWDEPRVPDPPPLSWLDWALVAAFTIFAVGEAIVRPDLEMRPVALLLGVVSIASLLVRRSHPLLAVVVAFGIHGLSYFAPIVGHDHEATTLYASAFVLLLPYSLLRWGSGRDAVAGSVFILLTHVGVIFEQPGGAAETIAGLAVLELPAALGAAVRYRSVSRSREIDQIKTNEREQLARELHDIVAHHVSAIVIQAQAGRAVAAAEPDAALGILGVIEAEATRTLAEMRTMVGALRAHGEPALAPQRGVADIAHIAEGRAGGPVVEVASCGDLVGLAPSVEAAVYRLAQESITNAIKHARRATRIRVAVEGEPRSVRLTVSDDGEPAAGGASSAGYGIVGMNERVALLGGTFEAGPNRDRGWTVSAVLPRVGEAP